MDALVEKLKEIRGDNYGALANRFNALIDALIAAETETETETEGEGETETETEDPAPQP
jgi:hypothetical protein